MIINRKSCHIYDSLINFVGAEGFEPPTSSCEREALYRTELSPQFVQ